MSTPVLSCTAEEIDATLARAAAVLRAGGLVALPTETVYGLAAHALDAAAVRRIFAAKGRPANNPLIVHVASSEDAARLVTAWPDEAARLAACFWPGPLTLVLPRREQVPDVVAAGGPTVAVRVPAHPVALRLLQVSGLPLAAPSANRSNRLSPTCAEHVLRDLDGRVDLILDGGPAAGGLESTVLDLTSQPPRLLRPGLIDPTSLEAVIGPVQRGRFAAQDSDPALPSPGLLSRHYAPRTPLETVAGSEALRRVAGHLAAGRRVGYVSTDAGERLPAGVVVRHLPVDAAGYAAGLYACLHALDRQGLDCIVLALPPEGDAWLAIHDRLRRASHPG